VGRRIISASIVFMPIGDKNIVFETRNDGRHIQIYQRCMLLAIFYRELNSQKAFAWHHVVPKGEIEVLQD
jgi:hypothetical protein